MDDLKLPPEEKLPEQEESQTHANLDEYARDRSSQKKEDGIDPGIQARGAKIWEAFQIKAATEDQKDREFLRALRLQYDSQGLNNNLSYMRNSVADKRS